MANARTTSLHEKLDPAVRAQVEADLVQQPPGRETYQKVWEHYSLGVAGISVKAVERYGGYLRALHRNQWIRELGDELVGEDLKGKVENVIRSRLYESLVSGEQAKFGDLMKAAITEKALREGVIKSEEWDAKRAKMEAELEKLSAMNGGHSALTPDVLQEIKAKVLGI